MADQDLLDIARSLGEGPDILDIAASMGVEERKKMVPGAGAAESAGETAGAVTAAGLTPFAFERGGAAMLYLYQKVFGKPGEAEFTSQMVGLERLDKEAQAKGGIRDTVGRTLTGMTAATLRGTATTLEMVVPDAIDPLGNVEGFSRGMANAAAVTSDTFTDKVTAAVTNGVANIALGVFAPQVAAPLFFAQGAGGAANEYDNAFIEGKMTTKDGIYRPSGKYIAALKGGAIEAATEWIGAKAAVKIGKSVWGKQAIKSIDKMNPSMKFATGLGLAYVSEGAEEGLATALYNSTARFQGQEAPELWDGAKEALADAFYGGFGGAGAHPFIAVSEASAAKRMRDRISGLIRESNGAFSDPDFWDKMPRATVESLRSMSPQERETELATARESYHQADADRKIGANAVNSAASALEKAQKNHKRVVKTGDQAKIDESQKSIDAAQVAFDSAVANQATLAAELLAARTRMIVIAAFNARNEPQVVRTVDDVLGAEKKTASAARTDADRTAEAEVKMLGYDIQFYDPTDPKDESPAFYNPATPNTIYLRAGMDSKQMGEALGFAYHEAMHIVQATDSDLWQALRTAFDEESVIAAGVQYFDNRLRKDDRLAQAAAMQTAEDVAGKQQRPLQQGEMIEQRAGRALLRAEGEARLLEDGVRELMKTGKAPGFLGSLIVKMGLRGRQAATALKVRNMMVAAAKQRGTAAKPTGLTEFGRQIEEAKGVIRAQELMETASPKPAPSAAPPAPPAPPTPSAAPSSAVTTASGMTPAEAARAETPDFKAMVNLALNNIRQSDKKFAQGKRIYPIMAAMESDPSTLSDEDKQIGRRLQQEMYAEFGPRYASLWARSRNEVPSNEQEQQPKIGREGSSSVEQRKVAKTGRYVGSPKWVGKSEAKLEQLRKKLRDLALEGAAGKMWYENSSKAILEMVGGDIDEAEKIVGLIAIYSPNATVPANTSMALTAYFQFKAGVPIKAGFRRADAKALALLSEGKGWSGIKTNSFYQNLMVEIDADKLDPNVATMDMWMALAFDYGSKALDQGPKYKFAENEIKRLAQELGWKPHQVQAAIWTAMKGRIDPIRADLKKRELKLGIGEIIKSVDPKTGKTVEEYKIKKGREYDHFRLAHKMGMAYALTQSDIAASKYDFSDAIRERTTQMSWEATPSTSAGSSIPGIHSAPISQQFEYLSAIMRVLHQNGRDEIADMVGLPQGVTVQGFSAFMGNVGAGAQTFIAAPLRGAGIKRAFTPEAIKLLEIASAIRGFVLEQDSVVFHTPVWEDAKIRHNGIQLKTSRAPSEQEMKDLYAALREKFKTDELAPGFRPDGVRILNFAGLSNLDVHRGIKEIVSALPASWGGGNVEMSTFRSEGGIQSNNWQEKTDGEDYRSRIEADRPDLLGRVADLRKRVQDVNAEFDAKYGWGATRILAARQRTDERRTGGLPLAGTAPLGADPSIAGAKAAPRIQGAFGPDPSLVSVAEQYARDNGIDLKRQAFYATVDEARARRIADAYEAMPHAPQDPAVAEAYQNLIKQTTAQYRALESAGYQFYFVDIENDPYADQEGGFGNPWNAMRDLRANKRMAVFPTEEGFGSVGDDVANNPLLADTGIRWGFGSPNGPKKPVTANDLFRAVHDAFGHGLEGAGFRAQGEENAWQSHVRLFTGSAVGALTSETRGQNSWLNYGPFGEQNQTAKVLDTKFAEQKSGLMPSWTWTEGRVPDADVNPSLGARFRKETGTPIETTTTTQLISRLVTGNKNVSEGMKGFLRTLNDIITNRDLAQLKPTANPQEVANAASGPYVEVYERVRAKFRYGKYTDPTIVLSRKDVEGDGRVVAHEMLHAATATQIDNYVARFVMDRSKDSTGSSTVESRDAADKNYNITNKSGKAYMDALARVSNHPQVDPAFKELIDCFLEAAKANPKQYAAMTEGQKTYTGFNIYKGKNPIEVVARPDKMMKSTPTATGWVHESVPYTAWDVVIRNATTGRDVVVHTRLGDAFKDEAEQVAASLRSGKPTELNKLFNASAVGIERQTAVRGRGAVNQGQGGDAMTRRGAMYGFGNLHEFIAETMTSKTFQDVLRAIPSKGRGASIYSRLVSAIRNLLGIPASQESMLDDVMRLTEEIATVEMTPQTQGRRTAVAGETVTPVQKKARPIEHGFPLIDQLATVYPRANGDFALVYEVPGTDLQVRTEWPRGQGKQVSVSISNNVAVPITVSVYRKDNGNWSIDTIRYRTVDVLRIGYQPLAGTDLYADLGKTKSSAAKKVSKLVSDIAQYVSDYNNDTFDQTVADAKRNNPGVQVDVSDTRNGATATQPVPTSLAARAPSQRFVDEVARGERKWALTDEDGKPVMVYHGTSRPTQIDPFVTKVGLKGEPMLRAGLPGMSFTDTPEFAETFGSQIYPAWISAKKPAVLDLEGRPWDRIPEWVAERLMKNYISDTYGLGNYELESEFFDEGDLEDGVSLGAIESTDDMIRYTTGDDLAGLLLAEGFDAVVLKDIHDEGKTGGETPGFGYRGVLQGGTHTEIVVGSRDPIINALTNQRITESEFKSLSARPRKPAETTQREIDFAYRIGRREGLVSGQVAGGKAERRAGERKVKESVRKERDAQREAAIAKRKELRTKFRQRVAALQSKIEAASETNDLLRKRMAALRKLEGKKRGIAADRAERRALKAWFAGQVKGGLAGFKDAKRMMAERMAAMRKLESQKREIAADRAARRVLKAWFAGQSKGSAAGFAEAKKEMVAIRKEAAAVIATLPPSMRGKYVNALATMKTAAGIDKVARRVVRDLAIAEAAETVGDINRLMKRIKKVGLRAETRENLMADLSAARSMLATGKKRLIPFTSTADQVARTAAARSLVESALHEFDMERAEYRDARDDRRNEAVADAIALGGTLAVLPKFVRGRISSFAAKRPFLADLLASHANADIYTIAQAAEGGMDGVIGKMWNGLIAAKGAMTLARKEIDESVDRSLRAAGYNGYDGYATNAAGLYGESSAEIVTVTVGGRQMTVTMDQFLHLAALDDQTVELLTDENDPAGTLGAGIVFSTDRNTTPIYMTQQEFADIRASLSTAQRQLIDDMKQILEDRIRPAAFDIHFQIHGRQPDVVPGYFPRKRLADEVQELAIDPNMQPGQVVNAMLSNAGFLQQRVAARSTLVIGGMMRTMDNHIEESLRMIHLSLPLRYAMSVLKSQPVRTGISEAMGDDAVDSIRKLVLNGAGLSGKPQGGLIEGINANVSGALITLNPKTWLRQLGGIMRLATEMPVGAWAAGVAQMAVMTPSQRRDMAKAVESMNGYFYDRHRRSQVGIFANVLGDPNTAKDRWASAAQSSARSMAALGESVAAGKLSRAARDMREGVLPISRVLKSADGVLRMIDRQIMLAAFLGSRSDVMGKNPTMSPSDVDLAAARMAEMAFRKTQNVSDPLDDTVYAARNKFSQGIGRLMFPFASDPLKGYNQIRRAIASRDPELIAKTTGAVGGNIALAAAVNPLWTAAGIAIANALGGGGDEEDEEMIKQMAMEREMSYILPRVASDVSSAAFGYLGMLAGSVVDGAFGSVERADDVMEPLVVRFMGDASQYLAKGEFPSAAESALQMAGVPVVAPFTSVTGVLEKAAPNDRKLLEYYRKLDKAGKLSPKQRQRLNVLAARERIRLAKQRREKQAQP